MPIAAEWDPAGGIWTLTTDETFELAEIGDLVRETDWKGGSLFLWDLRALTKGPDSTAELQQAVDLAQTSEVWRESRLAVVVTRDLDYGIARMFGAFANRLDIEYEVFRDERAAREWLAS